MATTTGAKVEGLQGDERVFGEYGPGPARDVISQILHGSSYNVLMLGDEGQGTPRQIILSERTRTGAQPTQGFNRQVAQQDDDVEQPEPEEPNQQFNRPPVPQPVSPPGGTMTPQQRMLELQRQQMQLQQQRQDQQVQPPPEPPNE